MRVIERLVEVTHQSIPGFELILEAASLDGLVESQIHLAFWQPVGMTVEFVNDFEQRCGPLIRTAVLASP